MENTDLNLTDGLTPQDPVKFQDPSEEARNRLEAAKKLREQQVKEVIPTPTYVPSPTRVKESIPAEDKPWFSDGWDLVRGVAHGAEDIVGDIYDIADFITADGLKDWDRNNRWVNVDSKAGELVSSLVRFGAEAIPVGAGLKAVGLVANAAKYGRLGAFTINSVANNSVASLIFQKDADRVLPSLGFDLIAPDLDDNMLEKRIKGAVDQAIVGLPADALFAGAGKAIRKLLSESASSTTIGLAKKERARLFGLKQGFNAAEIEARINAVGNKELIEGQRLFAEARKLDLPSTEKSNEVYAQIAHQDEVRGSELLLKELGVEPIPEAKLDKIKKDVLKTRFVKAEEGPDIPVPLTTMEQYAQIDNVFRAEHPEIYKGVNLDSFIGKDSVKIGVQALSLEVDKFVKPAFYAVRGTPEEAELAREFVERFTKSLNITQEESQLFRDSVAKYLGGDKPNYQRLASNLYAYSIVSEGNTVKIMEKLRAINLASATDVELSQLIRQVEEAAAFKKSLLNGFEPEKRIARIGANVDKVFTQDLTTKVYFKDKEAVDKLITAKESDVRRLEQEVRQAGLPLDDKAVKIPELVELRERNIKAKQEELDIAQKRLDRAIQVEKAISSNTSAKALTEIARDSGIFAESASALKTKLAALKQHQEILEAKIQERAAIPKAPDAPGRAKALGEALDALDNPDKNLTPDERTFKANQTEIDKLEQALSLNQQEQVEAELSYLYARIVDDLDASLARTGKASADKINDRQRIAKVISDIQKNKGKYKKDIDDARKQITEFGGLGEFEDPWEIIARTEEQFNSLYKAGKEAIDEFKKTYKRPIPDLVTEYKRSGISRNDMIKKLTNLQDSLLTAKDPIEANQVLHTMVEGTGYFRRIVNRMNAIQMNNFLGSPTVTAKIALNNVTANTIDSINTVIGSLASLPASVAGSKTAIKGLQAELGRFFGVMESIKDINLRKAVKSIWQKESTTLVDESARGFSQSIKTVPADVIGEIQDQGLKRRIVGGFEALETASSPRIGPSGSGVVRNTVTTADEVIKQLGYRSSMFSNIYADNLGKGIPALEAKEITQEAYTQLLDRTEAITYKSLIQEGREKARNELIDASIVPTNDIVEIRAQKYVESKLNVVGEAKLMEMSAEAIRTARINTASQDMSRWGSMLQTATDSIPAMKLIMPFIRGPFNGFLNAMDYMAAPVTAPLGWVRAEMASIKAVSNLPYGWKAKILESNNRTMREMMSGDPKLKAKAIGRAITSAALTYGVMMAAANPYTGKSGIFIIGTGPEDKDRQAIMKARGLMPNSIGYRDENGKITSFSYAAFEPIATLLTTVADFGAYSVLNNNPDREGIAWALVTAFKNIGDGFMFDSLQKLLNIVSGQPKAVGSFVEGLGNNMLPGSSIRTQAQNLYILDEQEDRDVFTFTDDTNAGIDLLREIGETLASKIPWTSSAVGSKGKRYDAFGNPVEGIGARHNDEFNRWTQIINPTKSIEAEADPVMDELIRVNSSISIPKEKTVKGKKVNLLDPKFNDSKGVSAYDQLSEIFSKTKLLNEGSARDSLSKLITTQEYKDASGLNELDHKKKQRYAISSKYNKFQEAAWDKLANQNPALKAFLTGN